METVTSSLMTRRNDDEDDKEEEEEEKAFSAVRFARKVFAYVVLYMFVRNSALTAQYSLGAGLLNTWRHVVATYDGTAREIWLDGVRIGRKARVPVPFSPRAERKR